jgi:serine/threonine-protein kinase
MGVTRERSAARLAAGESLDRYRLLYPVGRGGMGSVWCACLRDATGPLERRFAIKVLLPELAADEKFRTMLLDEGRIAGGIVHPNVARVIDVGEGPWGVYLVIEWIDGDSLKCIRSAATNGGPPPRYGLALRVLADACAGLHAAHELRDRRGQRLEIVHRDISPHNILISTSGIAKLIDFGIAKARGRMQGDMSLDGVKGKLRYMAPEQAEGVRVDRRADIWGMGATLQYVLTGRSPYGRESDADIYSALLRGAPHAPLPASVPRPIRAIVERALEREPRARFQTALEMKDALEAAADALDERVTTAEVAAYCAANKDRRADSEADSLDDGLVAAAPFGPLADGDGDRNTEPLAGETTITEATSGWIDVSPTRRYGEVRETPSDPEVDATTTSLPPPSPAAAERGRRRSRSRAPRLGRLLAVAAFVALAWIRMDRTVASSSPSPSPSSGPASLLLVSTPLLAPVESTPPPVVEPPPPPVVAVSALPPLSESPAPPKRRNGAGEHRTLSHGAARPSSR